MKSIIIKTAFIFLVSVAFAQTSSARDRDEDYRGNRHFERRERAHYYVPAPRPIFFVQPVCLQPLPYFPPVYGHPRHRDNYRYEHERREGYRR